VRPLSIALAALIGCGDVKEPSDSAGSVDSTDSTDSADSDGETDEGADSSTDESTGDDTSVNHPPELDLPESGSPREDRPFSIDFEVSDPDGDFTRVWVTGLPPGATWDEPSRTIRFGADFTQGGRSWTVQVSASDGELTTTGSILLEVQDAVTPPAPVVVSSEDFGAWTRLTLEQTTDAFLDSAERAGRTFRAVVTVPNHSHSVPVKVALHGYDGVADESGWEGEYRINPEDPENTYWWGYYNPAGHDVPPYTQRRVLHLLDWVLRTYPGADPERVYLSGASMGGAGAATLGLVHARHFAWVESTIGQMIPANHRPSRLEQLSGIWGTPAEGLPADGVRSVWDYQDLTWVIGGVDEARDQFVFTKHGKDDPTIHFGAVVHPSPLTGMSWYEAAQDERLGHYAVWDEGGHGSEDPLLGGEWWHAGWNPIYDDTAWLRRDRAFPAFSASSVDDDPGDGTGNGRVSWSDESGYAADVATPGDTGWTGDIAGAIGRSLRWDSGGVVDTFERFEIPLKVLDGEGGEPPAAGYPTTGDKLDGAPPVTVDVTLRRVQAFRCMSGERILWQLGDASGTIVAVLDGVTVPALPLTTDWQTLTLTRESFP